MVVAIRADLAQVSFVNNEKLMKNLTAESPKFEAIPPFPPDYSVPSYPVGGMPFESNDFNLQYQPPQYMPPIRLDIQFMPPPVYRFDDRRPFMALPPQILAPYPFVLSPLASTATKNKTTSLPIQTTTGNSGDISPDEDGTKKNKTRRSITYKQYAPRFYVVEDTETNVIDTWKDSNDYRYFANRWPMSNGPKTRINFWKKSNLNSYRNQHPTNAFILKKTETKNIAKEKELPKTLKNMVRIVPLKKDILREVKAKLRKLKEKGKLSPLVKKLFRYDTDKHKTLSKIIDISHTPLNEDRDKNQMRF
ncbi:hypothetical protein MSG28_009861 [Choristoneura fumiferana]|uniref:Uncharacterized protein n=1 Tax=Choristoneura fumiferana TaxID=7141 RepID=A0ACC0JD03_CHOFU|nr:hypothetical protein MSG28_009861 [Choristoneura fumiferana]